MTSAILSCCLYFCQLLLEFLKSFLNNKKIIINFVAIVIIFCVHHTLRCKSNHRHLST